MPSDTPRIDAVLADWPRTPDEYTGLEVELIDEGKKLERALARAEGLLREASKHIWNDKPLAGRIDAALSEGGKR